MINDKSEVFEWLKALFIAIAFAFVIHTFFFTPVLVDGASMEPTLQDQDRMILTKVGEPKRFDIIVFHVTEETDYIKRVIGLPGDRIEYKDDRLYINGKLFDEPYLDEFKQEVIDGPLTHSFTLRETPIKSEVVPEGHLFVMGDNRRYSTDSRHIGAVPMEKVVGTTKFVFYPIGKIKIIDK
ncbi:signal peptidase I [Cytobacillus eiseniae]|uniref:Signal peptidase I n=1 Tax=Cytobacillus eiseniae TaxID=762947 RepID=A0ABS4RDW5_9BACI|nr:signal peptidase I [Cytobacillus eiseniae]MBP2240904.1 signal peptidase I [Cytobacillus eiseniae]